MELKPIESIEYGLRFASLLSPWWQLLLLPLAGLAGWALYRVQFRSVPRRHALALLGLRIGLLVLLVFLAFRPSLVRKQTLTYNGRVLLVTDTSQSMATRDNAAPDASVLHVRRRLSEAFGEGAMYYQLSRVLLEIEGELRRFEAVARLADRSSDDFWDTVAPYQDRIQGHFGRFEELAAGAPKLSDELDRRFADLRREVKDLGARSTTFFSGDSGPGRKAFDDFAADLSTAAGELERLQGIKDDQDIANGAAALQAAAGEERTHTRIGLLGEKLAQATPTLETLLPNQFFQVVDLMSAQRTAAREFDAAALQRPDATRPGATDLVGTLETLLAEKSDFPLTAVFVLGDGRDLSNRDVKNVEQAYAQKQIPIHAAPVGAGMEPYDVAILRLIAPPFAAKETPVHVRLTVKAFLPAPAEVKLSLARGAEPVASEAVPLTGKGEQTLHIAFTPRETGVYRYTAKLDTVAGEAFPVQNNTMDFVVNVRDERAKVLLLDWKPRWETRFALNTFRRLDYIDLNPIVILAQENQTLRRGVQKGMFPDSLPALEMYDLVLLGDLPEGTLSDAEWEMLRTYVVDKGGSVCFLGSGQRPPVPDGPGLREALLPLTAAAPAPPADANAAPSAPPGESLDRLRRTRPGELHPVTQALPDTLVVDTDPRAPRARPDTQVLLASDGGEALLTARMTGEGKAFLIDTDRLWKALNPTALEAHSEMYVALLTWAIEGGYGPRETDASAASDPDGAPMALALDRRAFTAQKGLQVWAQGVSEGFVVEALVNDEVVASAPLQPARTGSTLWRAAFTELPAADVTFRLAAAPQVTAGAVVITRDDPELKYLARDDAFLRRLAVATGGRFHEFTDFERSFLETTPKSVVRKSQWEWRLWDAWTLLVLLAAALTVEWVYRKLVGLV